MRQSANAAMMSRGLPLPPLNSILNLKVQFPKLQLSCINNNICELKKRHYTQRLVFHGKLLMKEIWYMQSTRLFFIEENACRVRSRRKGRR